jgi:transposase
MDATTFAVDIAKNTMQLHWVEPASGEIGRRKLSRARFVQFFAQRQRAHVVMEACAGAHHWARQLGAMGHRVELLPTRQVRAFVRGDKDDAADARAIWLASRQPGIGRVAAKSVQQQTVLSLHRMRAHWVSVRTATINALRGLLYEFGVVLPQGKALGLKTLVARRAEFDAALTEPMRVLVNEQLGAIRRIDEEVDLLECQLRQLQASDERARRLAQVPGFGLLCSTALSAVLGDAHSWRSAREFSASIGMCPRHSGTGGKVRIGAMSKRGDPYLRTLLINGARALLYSRSAPPWAQQLLLRRPANVVSVALANKLARTAWALLAHQCEFDGRWARVHTNPQAARARGAGPESI